MGTRYNEQVDFLGGITVGSGQTCVLPSGVITAANIAAAAGVECSKLDHRSRQVYAQSGTAAAATAAIHYVIGTTGTINSFQCGVIGACVGDSTITIDLKKEGSSILSAAVVLDSTNAARAPEAGTLSSASVVAGDLLEVVVTVSAGSGTLGTGLFCILDVDEEAA